MKALKHRIQRWWDNLFDGLLPGLPGDMKKRP